MLVANDITNVNEAHSFAIFPLPSGTFCLSYDECLEDKREKLSELFCTLCYVRQLCTRLRTSIYEQFLEMIVALRLGLAFWVFCGRPFVKRFALCYQIVVCLSCPVCPVCDVGVLWPNGWMDQVETWRAGPRDMVLDGDQLLFPKGAQPLPNFRPMSGWIEMPLGTKVGLGPGHIVLDGDPAPQKGHSSPFSAHVNCGQTVAHLRYC